MNSNWNNLILQGLVGHGLVGYNTIKTLIDASEPQPEVVKDYAEYFPSLSFIDNGIIENQCVRLYHKEHAGKSLYYINGPQPRSEEMNSFFLQKIISDIRELHSKQPIDLFISFGALVSKNLSYTDFMDVEYKSTEELAEKILSSEIALERNLRVATCGDLVFDDFAKSLDNPKDLKKESQGYISGLNGVLPALVGERLKIPTVTIMVETTGTDSRTNNFPVLAQFLGLLATKKALQFIQKVFLEGQQLEEKVDKILAELKTAAKQELINYIENDFSAEKNHESDYRNDKMYT